MYCRQCGNPLNQGDRFCGSCGAEIARAGADRSSQQVPARANSGQDTQGHRRIPTSMWLLGAVVLALLGVGIGVGVMASGGGGTELLPGVRFEIPDGWALHSSSAAVEDMTNSGSEDPAYTVSLVPEQYADAGDSASVSRKAADVQLSTDLVCSDLKSDEIKVTQSEFGPTIMATDVMNNGSTTVGGQEAEWALSYSAGAVPQLSDYHLYSGYVLLELCFKDPDFVVVYTVFGGQSGDNPPTAERNASVPEYRAEVGKDIRQRYEEHIGAMTQLLEDMRVEGQSGSTGVDRIPTSLDNYSGVFEDPFQGKLAGASSSSSSDSAETEPSGSGSCPESYHGGPGTGMPCHAPCEMPELSHPGVPGNGTMTWECQQSANAQQTTTSEPSTPSGDEATDEQAAVEEVIRSHYEAIGRGDFEEAYSYFGPTFRDENTKEGWISEEQSQGIQDSTINSIEVTEVSGGTATAEVAVEFEDNRGTPRFNLTWSLVKEDGEWKLDDLVSGEEVS